MRTMAPGLRGKQPKLHCLSAQCIQWRAHFSLKQKHSFGLIYTPPAHLRVGPFSPESIARSLLATPLGTSRVELCHCIDHPAMVPELIGEASPRLQQELGGCISALLSLFIEEACASQNGFYAVRANRLLLHFQHHLSVTHIPLVPNCHGSAAGLAMRMLRRLFSSSRKVCAGVGMEASPSSLHPSEQPGTGMLRDWEIGAAAPRGCPEQTEQKPVLPLQTHSQASTKKPFRLLQPY